MTILCIVIWDIKPECTDDFIETLSEMFIDTKTHDGFISIKLLRSDTEENKFILVQEWEATQNHKDYTQYRMERGDVDKLVAMTAGPTLVEYWDQKPLASA